MLDDAIATGADVEMIYTARTGERVAYKVQPERMAFKADSPVLVGLDRGENERRTYIIDRIERMRKVIMS